MTSLSATQLQLKLDISDVEIELFGFSAEDPTSKLKSLAGAKNIEELSFLSIVPDNVNQGSTKEAYFYIWWYLYTGNSFSIKCHFHDFSANGSDTPIPFSIVSGTTRIDSLEVQETDNAKEMLKTELYKCDVSAGLNAGSMYFTIPSINYADGEFVRGDYSTYIYVEFSSNV